MNHADDKCSCYRLNELMEMEPENEKVYFNLGMLAMDAREFEKAREWFHQAVEVSVINFQGYIICLLPYTYNNNNNVNNR